MRRLGRLVRERSITFCASMPLGFAASIVAFAPSLALGFFRAVQADRPGAWDRHLFVLLPLPRHA